MIEIESSSSERRTLRAPNGSRIAVGARKMYTSIGNDRMHQYQGARGKPREKHPGCLVEDVFDDPDSTIDETTIFVKIASQMNIEPCCAR